MSRFLKVRARCKYLTARGLVAMYCQWRNDLSRKHTELVCGYVKRNITVVAALAVVVAFACWSHATALA